MDQKKKKVISEKTFNTPQKSGNINLKTCKDQNPTLTKSDESIQGDNDFQIRNLAKFYKEQRGKINLWTFLFKNLNQVIGQICIQCELEKSKEFCDGVISTLNNAIIDFQKLINTINVESRPTSNKPCAWEVSVHHQNQIDGLNSLEYENFIQDLEDADSVDFALLTQLVNDKKMTFDEAVVLLIRERALLLDGCCKPISGDNNSFISKYSFELMDQYLKEDSKMEDEQSTPRSNTPIKISLTKLMQRLGYRLQRDPKCIDDETSELVNQIKQERAEKFRKDQEIGKQEQIRRDKEKVQAAKEKVELKKIKQQEQFKQKYDEADQRYENHLNEIRKKAKVESEKANEIAFMTMLENQNMKITIEEKLQDALDRKTDIESKILNERVKNRKVKEDEVKRKRKEQEDEKMQKLKLSQIKRDEAESKRFKRIEDEKKKQVDESNKVNKVVKDKKEKDQPLNQTWELKILKLKDILLKEQIIIHNKSQVRSTDIDMKQGWISSEDEGEKPLYVSSQMQLQRQVNSVPHERAIDNSFQQLIEKPILFFSLGTKKQQIKVQDVVKKKKSKRSQKEKPKQTNKTSSYRQFRSQSEPNLIRYEVLYHYSKPYKLSKQSKMLVFQRYNEKQYEEQPPSVKLQKTSPKLFHHEEPFEQVQYYRLCQICNTIIPENESDYIHLSQNQHKQTKLYYNLMSNQDDILLIKGQREELTNTRFNAIRKRCSKIKLKIQKKSLILENINLFQGTKETMSHNKQRMQKICNDLDKQLSNQIKDLDTIEGLFKELIKVLENVKENKEIDLNLLRQLKFMPIVIELFKKVAACRKHEYGQFLKIIGIVSELLYQFCQNYDNRTYLIVGNRILPIIDFLYSLLATKPTKFIYGFSFVPQLFQIMSILIKHKLPRDPLNDYNAQEIQEDLIEYLFCSGLFHKMKLRFQCFEKDYINSEGKIPLALVKSVAFLEAISNYHGFDILSKPVYELPTKPNRNFQKHITFVLDESDMFGIIHLMSQMIVGEGVSIKNNKMIPQTTLSFLQVGIKTLNNIARLNLQIFQEHMSNPQNRQETHMIMLSLLMYCKDSTNQTDDLKDLLNELILMTGYYCVMNPSNQNSLLSGIKQISILHNLCDLPPHFYIDKNLINVLFPTLICCVFRNNQNMELLLNEISKDYFVKFISKEYRDMDIAPPSEDEEGKSQSVFMQRSPSVSSTGSSQNSIFPYSSGAYYKLSQRFPTHFYLEALREFNEFQDRK